MISGPDHLIANLRVFVIGGKTAKWTESPTWRSSWRSEYDSNCLQILTSSTTLIFSHTWSKISYKPNGSWFWSESWNFNNNDKWGNSTSIPKKPSLENIPWTGVYLHYIPIQLLVEIFPNLSFHLQSLPWADSIRSLNLSIGLLWWL